MESKELIDDVLFWLPKIKSGKTLIAIDPDHPTNDQTIEDVEHLVRCVKDSMIIEIKVIPFPSPPDGEEWQNPDKLTAEQVGIDDGWRLLLVSEVHKLTKCVTACIWLDTDKWSASAGLCMQRDCYTYRVITDEHPVGSLKPLVDVSREKIEADLKEHLIEEGAYRIVDICDDLAVDDFINDIKAGKIPNLEIKY